MDEALAPGGFDALIILGMHRSGTSLLAQACAAAGVTPGPVDCLLSAQADNPEGFFENRRLVAFNEACLARAGGSWFAPPQASNLDTVLNCASGDPPLDDAFPGGAETVVSEVAGDRSQPFFLKDPRLCLTWPLWRTVLPDAHTTFVYRAPLSVARSLARRNQFPLQYGLALWEVYNRCALQALSEGGGLAVSYDALTRGEETLKAVIESLAARGIPCDPGAAAEVFKPDLVHFTQRSPADDDASPLLTPSQLELHRYCVQLCKGGVAEPGLSAMSDLDLDDEQLVLARVHDFSSALAPLATVVETGIERDEALVLAEERTRERDASLSSLSALEKDHADLVDAHEAEQGLHRNAAATLQGLERDHAALAASHEAEIDRHETLQRAHERVNEELAERGEELLAVHAERDRLDHELRVTSDKADYLFFTLTESFGALIHFEQSAMAQVQRWARRLYRLFSFQRGRASAYEDVLERAHEHYSEFDLEAPRKQPGKLTMAADVIAYVYRNPAGSARSFSWARLRRATQVFFGSSSEELAVWVNARFPNTPSNQAAFDPAALDESLDDLVLNFARHENPQVSIILPVFNDYRVTVNCLQSVHTHTQGVPYEVIVADDCSTDLTTSLTERMLGVTVVRTPENQRFLRNCNNAASAASGEYLVFLNNDTAVTEGWLDALLEPLRDERVGVTGPKLLFADGRLQEAGGIIWRDASGWNFGRADDPAKPAYNYRRDVDYVSGACLAIRHALWAALGGFDDRFAPAYYEDADLCFEVRQAGYRVVYEPRSVVYHFEGVSNGTDLESGVKQHQVVNQQVFRQKWEAILDREHFPNAEHVVHARDRSRNKPGVLVIDHYVPHFDRDAGGRSTFMYLELLQQLGCRVQFMGANFFPHEPYTDALQERGIEVLVGESIARNLDRWLAENAAYIDHIFLHRPHVAEQFLPHLERMTPRPTIHYVGHDLHYLRFEREAALKDDEALHKEAARWQRRELAVCERADFAYYFSEIEIQELVSHLPGQSLRRLPLYAMPVARLPAYAPTHPADFLFVGGYGHPPNVDAATWIAADVLPRLLETVPQAHLHLVGSNPTPPVLELAGDHVTVHGYVSDAVLAQLYRRVGAAVVPLQYGAGVKGKVIEAIAQHVPLVTTDIGAEGIPHADRVMWIENSGEAIAACLARILAGGEDLSRLEQHESWLSAHFDQRQATAALREAIPELSGGTAAASAPEGEGRIP